MNTKEMMQIALDLAGLTEMPSDTSISVEGEDNTEWCCMPIQCLDISSSVYDSPACFLHSHCQ